MKTQNIAISELIANENNPRTITDSKLKQLAQSIADFPEMLALRPIVVDENMVVLGGNMRLKACKVAGIQTLPVVFADDLTDEQKREFVIKDNVGFGEWDADILADWDQEALVDWGLDLDFKTKTIARADRIPAVDEVNIVSAVGDVWHLGAHRLVCGDATSAKDVAKLMDENVADLIWTDPPYNVNIIGGAGKIQNDDMGDADFKKFLAGFYKNLFDNVKCGGVIYVAHGDSERVNFTSQFVAAGFKFAQNLIWNKNSATLSRQDYNWKHEAILFGWKLGAGHYFSKDFTQTTVFDEPQHDFDKMKKSELVGLLKTIHANFQTTVVDCDRPTVSELHPTMKPVPLVQKFVENSSRASEIVLDLFGGAGSTLIACENSARKCYMLELDPKFVDVILRRWQGLTGQKAICKTRKINIE